MQLKHITSKVHDLFQQALQQMQERAKALLHLCRSPQPHCPSPTHPSSDTPLQEALTICRQMVKYALTCGLVVNLLMLASPLYSMQVLDRVLSSGSHDTLVMLTLVMVLTLSLLGLIQGGRSFAMHRMGQWFERRLSAPVFTNAILAPAGPSGNGKETGGSQNLRDLQTIKTYLMSPGLITVLDTPWALVFIVVLFLLHSAVGWLTVVGALLIIGLGLLSDAKTKALLKANNDAFVVSTRHADQVARHAETVRPWACWTTSHRPGVC